MVLRARTDQVTAAIAAAPAASLPQDPAGERTRDYRCTWLRDSAPALNALGQLPGRHWRQLRDLLDYPQNAWQPPGDGLPGSEGQFLACSSWPAGALALNDRQTEARALSERLLALRNDPGPYAGEYDVARRRQAGTFPQAFTHLAPISAARILSAERTGTRSAPPHRCRACRR